MDFILLSETVAYENPFFSILDRLYRLPDGTEQHFYVTKEVDTCCVLAITEEGKFIAVKEYRVGPGRMMVELPAGRFNSFDDDVDQRIREELLEETGYTGAFKQVAKLPTSPYSTRHIYVYYATNCKKIAEQKLDHNEFIEVTLLKPEEMKKVLLEGKSSSCAPGLLAWEWMVKDGVISEKT